MSLKEAKAHEEHELLRTMFAAGMVSHDELCSKCAECPECTEEGPRGPQIHRDSLKGH